jgi:hypothetical protein
MHTPNVSHFSHVFSMDPSNQLISGWLVAALDLTSALGFRSIAAAASPARAAAPCPTPEAYPRSEPGSPVHELHEEKAKKTIPAPKEPKAVRLDLVGEWQLWISHDIPHDHDIIMIPLRVKSLVLDGFLKFDKMCGMS